MEHYTISNIPGTVTMLDILERISRDGFNVAPVICKKCSEIIIYSANEVEPVNAMPKLYPPRITCPNCKKNVQLTAATHKTLNRILPTIVNHKINPRSHEFITIRDATGQVVQEFCSGTEPILKPSKYILDERIFDILSQDIINYAVEHYDSQQFNIDYTLMVENDYQQLVTYQHVRKHLVLISLSRFNVILAVIMSDCDCSSDNTFSKRIYDCSNGGIIDGEN